MSHANFSICLLLTLLVSALASASLASTESDNLRAQWLEIMQLQEVDQWKEAHEVYMQLNPYTAMTHEAQVQRESIDAAISAENWKLAKQLCIASPQIEPNEFWRMVMGLEKTDSTREVDRWLTEMAQKNKGRWATKTLRFKLDRKLPTQPLMDYLLSDLRAHPGSASAVRTYGGALSITKQPCPDEVLQILRPHTSFIFWQMARSVSNDSPEFALKLLREAQKLPETPEDARFLKAFKHLNLQADEVRETTLGYWIKNQVTDVENTIRIRKIEEQRKSQIRQALRSLGKQDDRMNETDGMVLTEFIRGNIKDYAWHLKSLTTIKDEESTKPWLQRAVDFAKPFYEKAGIQLTLLDGWVQLTSDGSGFAIKAATGADKLISTKSPAGPAGNSEKSINEQYERLWNKLVSYEIRSGV